MILIENNNIFIAGTDVANINRQSIFSLNTVYEESFHEQDHRNQPFGPIFWPELEHNRLGRAF